MGKETPRECTECSVRWGPQHSEDFLMYLLQQLAHSALSHTFRLLLSTVILTHKTQVKWNVLLSLSISEHVSHVSVYCSYKRSLKPTSSRTPGLNCPIMAPHRCRGDGDGECQHVRRWGLGSPPHPITVACSLGCFIVPGIRRWMCVCGFIIIPEDDHTLQTWLSAWSSPPWCSCGKLKGGKVGEAFAPFFPFI